MKIPVGLTYVAHAILALVALAGGAVYLSMTLGWADFGSGRALGMLVGMVTAVPAGISLPISAYSSIAVIATLLRRHPVPPRGFVRVAAGPRDPDGES